MNQQQEPQPGWDKSQTFDDCSDIGGIANKSKFEKNLIKQRIEQDRIQRQKQLDEVIAKKIFAHDKKMVKEQAGKIREEKKQADIQQRRQ